MKTSILTGQKIYNQIVKLEQELMEFNNALDAVGDSIGTDSNAYRLLRTEWQKKSDELRNACNREFKVHYEQEGSIF